jgi:hypothetical protein
MPANLAHPKTIGDVTQAMVLARLVEAGYEILLPFGENQRYDLVIDHGDRFTRVQCKTGRLVKGGVYFPTCSTALHNPSARRGERPAQRDYRGQADLFGVYCPGTREVYLVPVDEVGLRAATLRITPPKNNQGARIRWALDYVVHPPG